MEVLKIVFPNLNRRYYLHIDCQSFAINETSVVKPSTFHIICQAESVTSAL